MKEEVLRYLGVKVSDERTEATIDEMTKACEHIEGIETHRCFDCVFTEEGLVLSGTGTVLKGNMVRKHFGGCGKTVIVLATLGLKSEILFKRIFSLNAGKGVVLDAVYTDKIECFLDETEKELRKEYGEITERISCGYGDLPIETQAELYELLNGERLGVKINDCYMLTPNKSVIALVGVK